MIDLLSNWVLPVFRTWERVSRLTSNLKVVLVLHAQIAQAELQREMVRIGGGAAQLSAGLVLLVFAGLLLHLAAVFYLVEQDLQPFQACLAVGGADVVIALPLLYLGRKKMAQPFMPESRALWEKTSLTLRP